MNLGGLQIRNERSFQSDSLRFVRRRPNNRAPTKRATMGMDMQYVFLSIGATGSTIVTVLNLIAWLWLDKSTAIPLESAWYSHWLPNYIVWLSCLILGALFWLFESYRNVA